MNKTRIILIFLPIAAWASEDPQPALVIATDATFARSHLVNDAGESTGFNIELARAAAKNAGFEPMVLVLP
jgi:ABC-type amino acid transport substrate-binding protein